MSDVVVPPGVRSTLNLELFAQVQPELMVDHLVLEVETPAGTLPVWTKEFSLSSGWQPLSVELAAFAGQTVSLRLLFDSVTGDTSGTDTVGIRGVRWSTACAPLTCEEASCDDGLSSTVEECVSGLCSYSPAAFLCSSVAAEEACGPSTGCVERTCVELTCTENLKPGCCTSAAECDDGNPCTEDACVGENVGQCVHANIPDCCSVDEDCVDDDPCTTLFCHPTAGCQVASTQACCESDAECEDGDPCTLSSCASGVCEQSPLCCVADSDCSIPEHPCVEGQCGAGGCVYSVQKDCCSQSIAFFPFDAADSLTQWVVLEDSNPEDGVQWHLNPVLNLSPPFALSYSDPASGTYVSGAIGNSGSIESPSFTGEPGLPVWVEFELYLATEFSAGGAPNGDYDRLEVLAVSEESEFPVFRSWELAPQWWQTDPETGQISPAWKTIGPVLLPPNPSGTWRLRWTFNTLDGSANGFSGATVDNLQIHQECETSSF